MDAQQKLITLLNKTATPLTSYDYSSLFEKIGNARFVMIGEATHGTDEFYKARIEISQQLIEKKGFMAIAIEGDWPDAHRVHRYIQGRSDDSSISALDDFQRFPRWMWRNTTMPPFLEWVRKYNDSSENRKKIGFYGLDLYSLNASMQAVIRYLAKVDPYAAEQAKKLCMF